MAVTRKVLSTSLMDSTIGRDLSIITSSDTEGGSCSLKDGKMFLISLTTSIVFDPGCLLTATTIARS